MQLPASPLLLLLLVVVAPALAKEHHRHSDRKNRNVLTTLLTRPILNFIDNHSISNVSENTFAMMAQSKYCTPVSGFIVQSLLERVRLRFVYGNSVSEYYGVSLENAPKLLNTLRWRKDRPIAVYTSGWLTSPTSIFSQQIVEAYHANGRYNLVLVDWHESGQFLEYGTAATMVSFVGQIVAKALQKMMDTGGTSIAHIAGHSLGAQVSGFIGRNLKERPPFIIGLDPAGPLFYPTMFGCQQPIKSSDALNVTVLHTDWGGFGANELTGPVDLMPDGGHRHQSGCDEFDIDKSPVLKRTVACSHNRAVLLFCSAIKDSALVQGRQCFSHDAFTAGVCRNNPLAYLVEPSPHQGVFYFKCGDSSPFGIGLEGT